jgi:hypothetical protein
MKPTASAADGVRRTRRDPIPIMRFALLDD